MKTRALLTAVALACGAPSIHAETLYVIEQLYVTVNTAADGSGERVGQIKSGDKVELIERQDDQAHVRLASGEEGWVKGSYLTAAQPLQAQLNVRNEELERLKKEKTQLETDLAAAKKATAAATASALAPAAKSSSSVPVTASAPVASTGAASAEAASPAAAEPDSHSSPPLFQDTPVVPARPSWLVTLVSLVLALVIGFALGWRMLDRRIRAKYGGLRIY